MQSFPLEHGKMSSSHQGQEIPVNQIVTSGKNLPINLQLNYIDMLTVLVPGEMRETSSLRHCAILIKDWSSAMTCFKASGMIMVMKFTKRSCNIISNFKKHTNPA